MRKFFSKEKSGKEKKADFYILYTMVFAAISLVIYGGFYFNGKALVWSHDGVPQHINALAYYGKYLRNVLKTLVFDHKISLPMWDMHIGYGSDILTTLHYYVIGDPLTLFSVFVPEKNTEILYEILIFLRIYLAGITFSIYCFYRKNPKQATFIGCLVYIFAGWTIYASMKHPYFSNPMIYLPLVLMGIDKVYKKEKPYLFIWATAVAAMSNFYFFYMISVFMVLYAAFRYFGIFRKRSVKDVFQWFLKFTGFYLVALMIAATIFLPVVMTLFGTERFQAEGIEAQFVEKEGIRLNSTRTKALIPQIAPGEAVSLQATVKIPEKTVNQKLFNQISVTSKETGEKQVTASAEITVEGKATQALETEMISENGEPDSTSVQEGMAREASTHPKTGDDTDTELFVLLALTAAITALGAFWLYRKYAGMREKK